MKRFGFLLLLALVGTLSFAQALPSQPAPAAPRTVTVNGTLSFVGDRPALTVDGKTLILVMPRFYYYAYTDGIKAGAAVKAVGVEIDQPIGPEPGRQGAAGQPAPGGNSGQASAAPAAKPADEALFIARELTVNGKTYVIVGPRMSGMGQNGMMGRNRVHGPEAQIGPGLSGDDDLNGN
jgi:hypothetical protein